MLLTQLRAFHIVAKAGGFISGAASANVSQPTLTAQVKALERNFSIELFNRRNRRSELTPAGHDLLAITTRLFNEEQEARDFLQAAKGLQTGQLRIGAVGPYHVTEMLAPFNQRYPGIKLSMAIGNSAEVQKDLLDYRTDIAVLAHIDVDERLVTIPYRRHPVLVFMRTDHRLACRKSLVLRDLEGESFVVRETGSTTRRAFDEAVLKRGISLRTIMEIGSREVIREAVLRGIGLGYVSEVEFIPDDKLVALPITDAEIYTYAHVAYLREREPNRIIQAFLKTIRQTGPDANLALPIMASLPQN